MRTHSLPASISSHSRSGLAFFAWACMAVWIALSVPTSSAFAQSGEIQFATTSSNVGEHQGPATFTLTRTGGSSGEVSARVVVTNGTTTNADHQIPVIDSTFDPGTGPSSLPTDVAIQPNGKLVIVGPFTSYAGTTRNRVARLNSDGTIDGTFDPGVGPNLTVSCVALQTDGKMLIGGAFTNVAGTARSRIARLNADGTLDNAFNPNAGAVVHSIVVQLDGKMLVGGTFTTMGGVGRNRIARLNADGTLDTSFDPGAGADDTVRPFALQPDGKVLIGGEFTMFDGIARNRIARLNADGSLDTSFDPGTGANDIIRTIALQPDGKVLLGGDFTAIDGTTRNRIARLNADGSLDTAFTVNGGADSRVETIALQADGNILLGGFFTLIAGNPVGRIARVGSDGSFDTELNPAVFFNSNVHQIRIVAAGKAIAAGSFSTFAGTERNNLARIFTDIVVSWPDSDTTDRVISLPITDDGSTETDETLTLTVEIFSGGATIGPNATHTLTILDDEAPVVTQVDTTAADGLYGIGADIDIAITFTNNVTVTGTPTLALDCGGTANYLSGRGTPTLTFRYTVAESENTADLNYAATDSLTLNGGTIDGNFTAADLTLPATGAGNSLGGMADIAIDGTRATIVRVQTPATNGLYSVGAMLDVEVEFSEPVTLAGGDLIVPLNSGIAVQIAPFGPATSATGTYIVSVGQSAPGLNNLSPLTLGTGATLRDAATNDSVLTVPAGQFLSDTKAIIVATNAELVVLRDGLFIANGGPDQMGTIRHGGAGTYTYSIHNPNGNGPLMVDAVSIAAADNCDATITGTFPVMVPVGDSVSFSVAITPQMANDFYATVKVESNAANVLAFNFTITGEAAKNGGCGALPTSDPPVPATALLAAWALLILLAIGRRRCLPCA